MSAFIAAGKQISLIEFACTGAGPHPAVLLLHGSGGATGAMEQVGRLVAAAGFHTFVVHYFESTGHRWVAPAMIEPNFAAWMGVVEEAVARIAEHPAVDAQRIALVGFSLGAYIALAVATREPRVAAVVDFYGGMPAYFAGQIEAGEITRFPPTLILHGEADTVVPVSEARRLEELLRKLDARYEMKVYPREGHVFSMMSNADAMFRIHNFLKAHLRRPELKTSDRKNPA